MPLDELMAKYQKGENKCPVGRRLGADGKPPVSPFLRARRSTCGASTSSASETGPSCSAFTVSSHGVLTFFYGIVFQLYSSYILFFYKKLFVFIIASIYGDCMK